MPIGDKFTGLDMEKLIGKPLKAADEAQNEYFTSLTTPC